MKLLYFRDGNELKLGINSGTQVIDVDKYQSSKKGRSFSGRQVTIQDLEELTKIGNDVLKGVPECLIDKKDLKIGPCVPNPQKIICIGLNYKKHAVESGMDIPTVPVVFTKYANTLVDYGLDVPLGTEGREFDYEVELGVVIGKSCKTVNENQALDYVLGYCTANDLSCRDLQFLSSQWLLGKSLDKFLPLGESLVTADEVGDPQKLQLTCTLNGETRQNSNTEDMIFPVHTIVSFLSKHMTLEPGDIILTGTPEGVIMGLDKKEWLKPGDVVTVEIEKLGHTTNKMI